MLDEQEFLAYDETDDTLQTENKSETIKDSHVSRSFNDFLLKSELLRAVVDYGYEHPSEVQYQAIPQAILGTDILCQAKSGMGKTTVFILATLQQLKPIDGQVSIIVLCHTRELAYNISREYERLCKYMPNVKISVFFGGLPIKNDQNVLKNNCPHIVLGTAGRILTLAKMKALQLHNIKHFIIDECDRVLESLDIRRDVHEIFKMTPREKQVLMFSATLNKEIRPVCKTFMQEPMEIYIDDETKLTLHRKLAADSSFSYDDSPHGMACTSCHTSACSQCDQASHEPIKCEWLKKWQKKCHDDSETSNWIAANTKECPKCHATIEKNGCCNYLICKNQSCKYGFCCICLDTREPHESSGYNCNRFNEDDAKKACDEQKHSRSVLQQHLHYYEHYHNHQKSMLLEEKLFDQVNKRMEAMQQQMNWIEVQFLQTACEVLRQCRQTLMYTYPFAFYLEKNNHAIIFEANQADLEDATAELSDYLKRDFTQTNASLTDMKQQLHHKYRYCDSRRKVLLDHVAEGYNCDYWQHNEEV